MTHSPLYNVYISSCRRDGGICHYHLFEDGTLDFIEKTHVEYPMYTVMHDNKIHAVLRRPFENNEESGYVCFTVDAKGRIIGKSEIQSAKGAVACHLAVDEAVYCANYISGSVVRLPDKVVAHKGNSIHPTRQTAPHVHHVAVTPDGKYLCVADLGLDELLLYDKDLRFISKARVPQGHGARHVVFSHDGKYCFCANELASTVTVLEYHAGKLTPLDTFHGLPPSFKGENTAAAIRISKDDRRLYLSNRGHNSIACFTVNDGELTLTANVDCGGNWPRDFDITPDGKLLLCANEHSDNVTVFKITDNGLEKLNRTIEIKSPLCVIFSEVQVNV